MPENLQDDILTQSTLAAVQRFNAAFNQHDVTMIMANMTEDCVFENTYPAPDGERYVGHKAVRDFWEKFFASSSQASFETEEMFACGDRCLVRWQYRWVEQDGKSGHIRGIDVLRVRDGKVAEKFSYVKG
ncbi:MAG: nuclear transport factor 2 family protein [Chloroflexi bacterium HGW-Chloroflexi-6]|nr:MAG: nuclear transport factor 2 family protein [Chloroflexi bacterium HGW-Chloroflexi-6]